MPEQHVVDPAAGARPTSWPDMPLIIEQLQDQIDALRGVVETQDRQLTDLRARLAAFERR